MKIAQTHSHLNGFEFLQYHKRHLWDEIVDVITRVDADELEKKVSKEKTMVGKHLFSPKALNKAVGEKFRLRGWRESRTNYWITDDEGLIRKTLGMSAEQQKVTIEKAGRTAMSSYNQTDFTKERVAVEVQFGKYSFVAYDLFVKHMAFFVGDEIDLGIEILPMKSLSSEMSTGIGYFERELYNLIRQGRGIPAVPLVLIGVTP